MKVAVIGTGIMGLCSAYYLRKAGHDVTIIGPADPAGDGCSHGNGGIIVPSHFTPIAAPGMVRAGLKMMLNRTSPFGFQSFTDLRLIGWVAQFLRHANASHVARCAPILAELNLESRALYEELITDLDVAAGYGQRGLLMLCETEHGLHEESEMATVANRYGLKTRIVDQKALAELEPNVQARVCGAVHFEDDAHLDPKRIMTGLQNWLLANHVEWLSADVTGFARDQQTVHAAQTTAGDVHADAFVLAAGVWTCDLAAHLDFRMPLVAGRGFGFTVPAPNQPFRHPAILTEARVAITPMPDGTRFVGTMELGRPEIRPDSPRVLGMKQAISRAFPAYDSPTLHQRLWCGLRPCSPDGMPYLGRTERYRNVLVSAGHAMMGLSLGPISGKIICRVLEGENTHHELKPDRFG